MHHREAFKRANSKLSIQLDDLLWKTCWFLSNHSSDHKGFTELFQIKEGLVLRAGLTKIWQTLLLHSKPKAQIVFWRYFRGFHLYRDVDFIWDIQEHLLIPKFYVDVLLLFLFNCTLSISLSPLIKKTSLILRCNAVKALLVEIWFKTNQRVFHNTTSVWSYCFEYAPLNASSWCSIVKGFQDYSKLASLHCLVILSPAKES